jgi:hypothetical protein
MPKIYINGKNEVLDFPDDFDQAEITKVIHERYPDLRQNYTPEQTAELEASFKRADEITAQRMVKAGAKKNIENYIPDFLGKTIQDKISEGIYGAQVGAARGVTLGAGMLLDTMAPEVTEAEKQNKDMNLGQLIDLGIRSKFRETAKEIYEQGTKNPALNAPPKPLLSAQGIGQIVGGSAPAIATTVITKNPAAGAMMAGAMGGGSYKEQALAQGDSEAEANKKAALGAVVEGSLELIGGAKVLDPARVTFNNARRNLLRYMGKEVEPEWLSELGKITYKETVGNVMEKGITQTGLDTAADFLGDAVPTRPSALSKTSELLVKPLTTRAKEYAGAASGEFGTEFLQSMSQDIIVQEGFPINNWNQWVVEGLVGGAMGAGFHGAVDLMNTGRLAWLKQKYPDLNERIQQEQDFESMKKFLSGEITVEGLAVKYGIDLKDRKGSLDFISTSPQGRENALEALDPHIYSALKRANGGSPTLEKLKNREISLEEFYSEIRSVAVNNHSMMLSKSEAAEISEEFNKGNLIRYADNFVQSQLKQFAPEAREAVRKSVVGTPEQVESSLNLAESFMYFAAMNDGYADVQSYMKDKNISIESVLEYTAPKDSDMILSGQMIDRAKIMKDSKIRDANGKLRMAFHGTTAVYDQPNDEKFMSGEGAMMVGRGHYYTFNKGVANYYWEWEQKRKGTQKPSEIFAKQTEAFDQLSQMLMTEMADAPDEYNEKAIRGIKQAESWMNQNLTGRGSGTVESVAAKIAENLAEAYANIRLANDPEIYELAPAITKAKLVEQKHKQYFDEMMERVGPKSTIPAGNVRRAYIDSRKPFDARRKLLTPTVMDPRGFPRVPHDAQWEPAPAASDEELEAIYRATVKYDRTNTIKYLAEQNKLKENDAYPSGQEPAFAYLFAEDGRAYRADDEGALKLASSYDGKMWIVSMAKEEAAEYLPNAGMELDNRIGRVLNDFRNAYPLAGNNTTNSAREIFKQAGGDAILQDNWALLKHLQGIYGKHEVSDILELAGFDATLFTGFTSGEENIVVYKGDNIYNLWVDDETLTPEQKASIEEIQLQIADYFPAGPQAHVLLAKEAMPETKATSGSKIPQAIYTGNYKWMREMMLQYTDVGNKKLRTVNMLLCKDPTYAELRKGEHSAAEFRGLKASKEKFIRWLQKQQEVEEGDLARWVGRISKLGNNSALVGEEIARVLSFYTTKYKSGDVEFAKKQLKEYTVTYVPKPTAPGFPPNNSSMFFDLRNPVKFEAKASMAARQKLFKTAAKLYANKGLTTSDVPVAPYDATFGQVVQAIQEVYSELAVNEVISAAGYDGFIRETPDGETHYAGFSSEQVVGVHRFEDMLIVKRGNQTISESTVRNLLPKARGYIRWTKDGSRFVISLVRGAADATTLVHEVGHYLTLNMQGAAKNVLEKYIGKPREAWNEAERERAAEIFETFLYSGEAPIPELIEPLQVMRKEMERIAGFSNRLNKIIKRQLPDDIRGLLSFVSNYKVMAGLTDISGMRLQAMHLDSIEPGDEAKQSSDKRLNRKRPDLVELDDRTYEFLNYITDDGALRAVLIRAFEEIPAGSIPIEHQYAQAEKLIHEQGGAKLIEKLKRSSGNLTSTEFLAINILLVNMSRSFMGTMDMVRTGQLTERGEMNWIKFREGVAKLSQSTASEAGRILRLTQVTIATTQMLEAYQKLKASGKVSPIVEAAIKNLDYSNPQEVETVSKMLEGSATGGLTKRALAEAFLYMNMLSSLRGMGANNIYSNTAWLALETVPKHLVNVAVDYASHKIRSLGKSPTARKEFIREMVPGVIGALKGFGPAAKETALYVAGIKFPFMSDSALARTWKEDDPMWLHFATKWENEMGKNTIHILNRQMQLARKMPKGAKGRTQALVMGYTFGTITRIYAGMDMITKGMARDSMYARWNKKLEILDRNGTREIALRQMAEEYAHKNYHGAESKREEYIKNLIANPWEMVKTATQAYMERVTFQEFTEKNNITRSIIKARDSIDNAIHFPVVKFTVMPFVNITANFVRRSVELTPGVGAISKTWGDSWEQVASNQILGAMIWGMFTWMFDNGWIEGAPPDDENERKIYFDSGKRPYSFKVQFGNEEAYIPIPEPFSFLLIPLLAGLSKQARAAKEGDDATLEETIISTILEVKRALVNSTFLGALSNALGDDKVLPNKPERLAGMFLPYGGLMRSIAEVTELRERGFISSKDTSIDLQADGIQGTLLKLFGSSIPGLRDQVPDKLTVFGEPVSKRDLMEKLPIEWLPAQIVAYGVTPYGSYSKPDDFELEMSRIGYYPGPPLKYITIAGREVELPKEVYTEYCVAYGMIAKAMLPQITRSQQYKGYDTRPEIQLQIIDKAMSDYRAMARAQLLKAHPELVTLALTGKLGKRVKAN